MLPNFVILGAQKSATTFIHDCLSEHPEIYMPSGEISFFESPDYEQNSIAYLEQLFEGRKERVLGIKRPTYLGKKEVPDRIREHLPDAKLIVILRNPVERAVSAYFHNINYGFLPVVEIEKGFKLLMAGEFKDQYKRASEIIDFGYYYKHLSNYQYYFDKKQILVILHDDIINNQLGVIKQIYQFLDVNSDYQPKSINSRPQKVIYNFNRIKISLLRNNLIYYYDDTGIRLHIKKGNYLNKFLSTLLIIIDKLFLSLIFKNKKPVLSNKLKHTIYNIYKEDILSLESLIGRDLSHWKPVDTLSYIQYGCGWSASNGWRNFDASLTLWFERIPFLGRLYTKNASRFPETAEYGDIVRGLPVADNSCTAVYCSHVLEHLSLADFKTALKNTHRILVDGGLFRLVLPDLEYAIKEYVENQTPDAAPTFMRTTSLGQECRYKKITLFLREWFGNSKHLWMWDYKSIEKELSAAGFIDIRRAKFGDSTDTMFNLTEDAERWKNALGVECKKSSLLENNEH